MDTREPYYTKSGLFPESALPPAEVVAFNGPEFIIFAERETDGELLVAVTRAPQEALRQYSHLAESVFDRKRIIGPVENARQRLESALACLQHARCAPLAPWYRAPWADVDAALTADFSAETIAEAQHQAPAIDDEPLPGQVFIPTNADLIAIALAGQVLGLQLLTRVNPRDGKQQTVLAREAYAGWKRMPICEKALAAA